MENEDRIRRLSWISPNDADDIDAVLAGFDPAAPAPGGDVFPDVLPAFFENLEMEREDAIAVGVRQAAATAEPADLAMRLASFAVERDVEVIVLAAGDADGLERYGFRIERLAGDSAAAQEACLAQLRRFWHIDLIL